MHFAQWSKVESICQKNGKYGSWRIGFAAVCHYTLNQDINLRFVSYLDADIKTRIPTDDEQFWDEVSPGCYTAIWKL